MVDSVGRGMAGDWPGARARCQPGSLRSVRIGGFLGIRVDANVESILAGLASPIPRRFQALNRGEEPGPETMRLAADSDLYKWIEGASYALAYGGDPRLRESLDCIVPLVLEQQRPDGYINTLVPPYERFDTRVNHDLYIAGHFFEAAVAHYRATGERALLDAAGRWALWLHEQHQAEHPYFQQVGEKEHPEIELGLVRLYRATGDDRFLELGRAIAEMSQVSVRVADLWCGGGRRHAVRVGYLLTAWAELFLETGEERYLRPLLSLWDELVKTRLYLTGGIGYNERIPARPYDLPQSLVSNPDRDIAETCASVAMMMLGWRLHAVTGDSRYFDTIETILYNHYLGALSLDNLANFYYNPLRVVGDQTGRSDHGGRRDVRTRLPAIHSTACCMPNAWRTFASLPEYLFSVGDDGIYVNLYTDSVLTHRWADGHVVHLSVETDYPRSGRVRLGVESGGPRVRFALHLRIPGWCDEACVIDPDGKVERVSGGQYAKIRRTWGADDRLTLDLPMPVRRLVATSQIVDCAACVAVRRGPLVYCLEQEDVGIPIERVRLRSSGREVDAATDIRWENDLLGGVNVISMPAQVMPAAPKGSLPYYEPTKEPEQTRVRLIPFYARANRGESARWLTWIPQAGP